MPVAADDWYQRRRRDAEGEFFRKVANQGPRKGEGGDTRQGIYCLTASGKLLAYKNAGQSPEVMREVLREGLKKWNELPETERKPGAVPVPEHGAFDRAYHRAPPPNGLILNVYTRALDRAGEQNFSDAVCRVGAGDEAARDHLWLTESEWKSLLLANPRVGETFPMPAKIAERVARFHLVDNTRGEPPMWRRSDLRKCDVQVEVESIENSRVRLLINGTALLSTDADPDKADRGFDSSLLGYIEYHPREQRITRFDVVAVGDHWGSGAHTRRRTRPGRSPLGVAFELTEGKAPADRIAPQAARGLGDYFGGS